jgi:TPR repeat protein
VPTDRALAMHWFREAADRSHPQAQLMLARYLALGIAGPANLEEARVWFKRAQDNGIAEAAVEMRRYDAAATAPATSTPIELTESLEIHPPPQTTASLQLINR